MALQDAATATASATGRCNGAATAASATGRCNGAAVHCMQLLLLLAQQPRPWPLQLLLLPAQQDAATTLQYATAAT